MYNKNREPQQYLSQSSFELQVETHTYTHTCRESNLYSDLDMPLSRFTILNSAGPSAANYSTTERNTSQAHFFFFSLAIFYSLQTNSVGGSELLFQQTSSL